jgi:PadR family transcriptional regulator PadR
MRRGSPGGRLEGMMLAILADGPLHGYAVISELRRRSDEAFDLPEGTVYPVLHKLQQQGHISSTLSDVGGRSRRTYRITRRGIQALEEERRSWASFRAAVSKVLGEEPWPATT